MDEEFFIIRCFSEGLYSIIYVNKFYIFLIYRFGIDNRFGIDMIVLYLNLICKRRGL